MKNQCCAVPSPTDGCPMKKCLMTALKGALVGGILMFIIFSVSWMALPFHLSSFNSFKSDVAVANVINANAEKSGIYMLPRCDKMDPAGTAAPAKGKAPAEVTKPFAFVSVFKDGMDQTKMGVTMWKFFMFTFFVSALLTCVLKKMSCCGCPVGMSVKLGVLVALCAYVPNMIWFKFPMKYSLLGMADIVIAFAVAGWAISRFCLDKKDGGSCSTGTPAPMKTGCCG